MAQAANLPQLDVAIVGGGVSGIYTAWRLLEAQSKGALNGALAKWASERAGKLKVGLYEGSNRIGGRLLSARSPNMPDTTCELGGMRYHESHKRVANLVKELDLSSEEQDVGSNIYFLRNCLLRDDQLRDPRKLPYHFDDGEGPVIKGKGPFSILEQALRCALPELEEHQEQGRAHLYQWLQGQCVDGRALYDWGFWNLLLSRMSGEGYESAIDTIGYDVLGANYNSVDMIAEIFDFTPDAKYRKLQDGYEILPWTLKTKFREYQGEINHGWWLKGFNYHGPNKTFTLNFLKNRSSVTTRALVLALPRRSIERLLRESPDLERMDQGTLIAVEPIRLFKLFLIYGTPWWEKAGVNKGRSLTDLPLRQCYYWAVSKEKQEGPAAIMVYNDFLNVDYWGGLRTLALSSKKAIGPAQDQLHPWELQRRLVDEKFANPPEAFEPEPALLAARQKSDSPFHRQLVSNWEANWPEKQQVKEMHRLLLRMHRVKLASEPLDAAVLDWTDAVHLWNVGYKSWEVAERMIQPDENMHCYICGEAYSTYQTWVEGALQTSNCVLDRLGVK